MHHRFLVIRTLWHFNSCKRSLSIQYHREIFLVNSMGTCQKLLHGIFPLMGYPPPTPFGNSFCQKILSVNGGKWGVSPPHYGKSPKFSAIKWSEKGLKLVFWVQNTCFWWNFCLATFLALLVILP